MFLILEDYFKDHPTKARITRELFDLGISVVGQKLYLSDMELSIGEISKKLNVNRRTLYETIAMISENPEIRKLMGNLRPIPDLGSVYKLFGGGTVTIEIQKGKFSYVFKQTLKVMERYSFFMREIRADNCLESPSIRMLFHKDAPKRVYSEISEISGVKSIWIETQKDLSGIVCNGCKVKLCPEKSSTSLNSDEIPVTTHGQESDVS